MACFFATGYAQHIPGENFVLTNQIPGLLSQLRNNLSNAEKASVLLHIGYGYLYKVGEYKDDLDTAMQYARQLTELGTRLHNASYVQQSLLLTGLIYMERKNFVATDSLLPALNDTTRLKMLLGLSRFASNMAAETPEDRTSVDRAARYTDAALPLALKTGIQNQTMAHVSEFVATQYKNRHLTDLAEKYYLLTLISGKHTGYPSPARAYANVSGVYSAVGNFYKAMDYGIKAEKSLNAKSSDQDLVFVYNSLGSLGTVQDKLDKVLYYYGKLMANPQRYRQHMSMYTVSYIYCTALMRQQRMNEVLPTLQKFQQQCPAQTDADRSFYHLTLGNYYKDAKQFDSSEKNFLESIRYAEAINRPTSSPYHNLGILYYNFNKYDKAIAALKISEKKLSILSYTLIANNQLYMAKAEAALGHYATAYDYLLKSKTLSDSIFTVGKARLSDELETQYQTQKKEADLRAKEENIRTLNQHAEIMQQEARLKDAKLTEASLLSQRNEIALQLKAKDFEILERNSKLQKAAIEHANSRRKITFLVMILMAVIAVLLCWLFWSKLRSNRVITRKNEQLQQLVKDKSWLLKEMHHRVKNNLHTIVSLLESQSSYLHDDALDAIRHSQSRIFSMSLIHQQLYQADDTKTIDMAYYIPELVSYLKESFSLYHSVHIVLDIDHAVFQVEEAVPLGLIVNEVVTNSMKYAFKDGRQGEIIICLKDAGHDQYGLTISDNGTGLQEDFDLDKVTSLGFQLIRGLSEQLHATLHIANQNGLRIAVSGISVYNGRKLKAMESELQAQMAV